MPSSLRLETLSLSYVISEFVQVDFSLSPSRYIGVIATLPVKFMKIELDKVQSVWRDLIQFFLLVDLGLLVRF
jgi:hypothetical protein